MTGLLDWIDWIQGITEGHWLVDVTVLAGGLTALGWIGRKLLRVLHRAGTAVVRAIQAAPRIAEGVEELQRLIEADVLASLQAGKDKFAEHDALLARHEPAINEHSARLQAHDDAVVELRARVLRLEHPGEQPLDG